MLRAQSPLPDSCPKRLLRACVEGFQRRASALERVGEQVPRGLLDLLARDEGHLEDNAFTAAEAKQMGG
jgi:hypothetical protein